MSIDLNKAKQNIREWLRTRKILLIILIVTSSIALGIYVFIKYNPNNNTIQNKIFSKVTEKPWEGEWTLEGATQDYSGIIFIKNQTENSFTFSFNAYNGVNVGNMDGEAKIVGTNASATIGDASDKECQCQVDFSKNKNKIEIKTTNCDCFHGLGVSFEGNYIKNRERF